MLSLFSPLVTSHRISFSRKYLRIALFSVFCALLIAPSLPAQAQNFQAGIGTTGDFFFSVKISSMPQNTDTITIHVWHGGRTIIGPSSYQVTKNKAPFTINIGNIWSDDFHPSRSLIKPGTTYGVEAEAIRGTQTVGYQWFTLTTTAERNCYQITGSTSYHNCPEVNISHVNHSDSTLKFRIVKVPGANYYKVPSQYACGVAMDQGYPGHLTGLGELLKWTPGKRVIKSLDFTDMFEDDYTVYYSCLRANHTFQVTIEAHQYYTVTGVSNGRSFTSKQSRLIAKSTMVMSTKPRTMSSQQLGQQLGQELAPTATPSPTAIPPIYIEVDYHGNHDTAVTLSWTAPGGYPAGYVLQVVGGDNESYVFHLGRKETSQRVNGLSPGADYTAYLTAYLQDGGKRSGETHFGMADPPPTNTPIPPTATPIPQQSSEDSVQDQSPPQLQYSPMQAEEDEPQPSGPYASLIRTLIGYQGETQHGDAHVLRWTRALAALGWGSHSNPMTLSEAKTMRDKYSTSRWQPVVDALTALQPPTATPVPPTPIPPTPVPPTPVPPTPVPPTPIPPTPVPPTPVPPTPVPAVYKVPQSLINTLVGYQAETQHGDAHVERWTRALAALGHGSHNNPMTLSEAEDMADKYTAKRWQPVIDALEKLAGN